ncbi:MAG: HutD family protein [Pseudomonadota bacterium]
MRQWNAGDCPAMPWKNGGGVTTELAVAPDGASLDNFDWRISSALVSASGPFSHFAGIDRSLAILQGGTLNLSVDGSEGLALAAGSDPFCFRGEQQVYASVAQGAVTDFNVMTRRSRYSHSLLRLAGDTAYVVKRRHALVLVYCVQGRADIRCADSALQLRQGDMLMLDRRDEADSLQLQCGISDIFYVIHLAKQE